MTAGCCYTANYSTDQLFDHFVTTDVIGHSNQYLFLISTFFFVRFHHQNKTINVQRPTGNVWIADGSVGGIDGRAENHVPTGRDLTEVAQR